MKAALEIYLLNYELFFFQMSYQPLGILSGCRDGHAGNVGADANISLPKGSQVSKVNHTSQRREGDNTGYNAPEDSF